METINERKGYLVLTKADSLLYLFPAYLRTTALVALFFSCTSHRGRTSLTAGLITKKMVCLVDPFRFDW